ncbi:MAG: hypothetical protein WBE34_21135 [Candidatus Nitrosopolaris sp.]
MADSIKNQVEGQNATWHTLPIAHFLLNGLLDSALPTKVAAHQRRN